MSDIVAVAHILAQNILRFFTPGHDTFTRASGCAAPAQGLAALPLARSAV